MRKGWLKNTALTTVMATTLTACGGGGGGGAIGIVDNFVQDDLTNLVGSESIINSYSSLLTGFNSTISSGNFASLSALVTDPTDEDISKANTLLSMLEQAETLWTQTLNLIESQDADTKLSIYNSDDYKNAHAALLYLKNHVKPIMTKVSQGQKLSLTEYQKIASDTKAQQLIEQEKDSTVEDYITEKKNKINQEKQEQQNEQTEEENTEEDSTEESTEEESTEEESTEEESTEDENTEESNEQAQDPWQGIEDNKQYLGTTTPNYNTDKTTYETTEYKEDNNGYFVYDKIKVSSAYSKGWTGQGSIVAIADTGYDTDHGDLEGQIIDTKDYYGNGIQDNHGHGSHVVGSIVAKKNDSGMHGVAFDAKAIVIKIADGKAVSLDDAANGFSWAADKGAIVGNLSANSNYDSSFRSSIVQLSDNTYKSNSQYYDYGNGNYYNNMTTDLWKLSTDKGMVLVNSAGNQGLDISAMPGWFATETDENGNLVLGGKVLIVGSYNFNSNSIDSFSNKAGHLCRVVVDNACTDQYKTSDFYVLAPGWTYSTNNEGGYSNMTGTSMAAPIVTGQLAILHQMWPHMKGENLVKLVTTTADKNISNYNVNIHGQGIVDFDEATKPQGSVGIPVSGRVDGSTSSISNTQVSTGSTSLASLSNLKIMVIDDFDRDYYMNVGNSFTVLDNRKYSDVQMLVENKNTFLPHNQMYGSFAQGGQYDLANNYNFGLYTGENGNGDYSLNVGKDWYVDNKFKIKTSLGYMSEQDNWLGNFSDGALAVGDNNDTKSASIGVSYQLGNNVLSLDYSKGSTDINTIDNSIIKSFSNIETESYRLAYEIHKDTHTTFGWSFSLPSHITSGSMDLEVAESVNLDGTINYTNIRSDLAQSSKEKNIGFFFSTSPKDTFDAGINFTAEYRMDKSGVTNNDGVEVGLNVIKKFAGSCKFLWMKNPKCFNKDGQMKANLFGTSIDNVTKHGLVYDLKTDKFIPNKK